jgi:hypothetical protein
VAGLSGDKIATGDEVDPGVFVGKLYRLRIAVNPVSDTKALHVADIELLDAVTPASSPSAAESNGDTFWIDNGAQGVTKGTADEVRALIFAGSFKAADVLLRRPGEATFRPANEFGFEDAAF